MHYTTHLHDACIQDVLTGVERLAAAAKTAMREHPLRPQHASLHVAELTVEQRPIYAQKRDRRLFCVFRELPREGLPFGDRVLVVGVPPLPDCPAHDTNSSACCGECRSTFPLEVRIDPRFPLDPTETRWKLAQIFRLDEALIVDTHPSWLTQDRHEDAFATKSLPPTSGASPKDRGQCPGERLPAPHCAQAACAEQPDPYAHCRQPSPSTLKLEPLVEAEPDMHHCNHLIPTWLPWYVEDHGREPVDIKGSFRHAVKTCIRRIESRRAAAAAGEHADQGGRKASDDAPIGKESRQE
jgi:hypothetical protein